MRRVMQAMMVKVIGMNDEMKKAKVQAIEQGDGYAPAQGRRDTSTDCGGPANSPAQSTQHAPRIRNRSNGKSPHFCDKDGGRRGTGIWDQGSDTGRSREG